MTLKQQVALVEEWNRNYPVGTKVRVRLDSGEVKETELWHPCTLLGGHTAVAWLKGVSGCYALTHCTPVANEEA